MIILIVYLNSKCSAALNLCKRNFQTKDFEQGLMPKRCPATRHDSPKIGIIQSRIIRILRYTCRCRVRKQGQAYRMDAFMPYPLMNCTQVFCLFLLTFHPPLYLQLDLKSLKKRINVFVSQLDQLIQYSSDRVRSEVNFFC